MKFNLSPLGRAVAAVLHLWRTDPGSPLLAENQPGAQPKPKRVRVRAPKLGPEDIVAGGVYVPKRGNNRTPNLVIERTTLGHELGRRVWYRQRDEVRVCTESEFLSLVSRRIHE